MNYSIRKIYLFFVFSILIAGCSPTRDLAPGEVYLKNNKIKIPAKVVTQDKLFPYLKQMDNKRVLWLFKIQMWQYLSFNEEKVERRNEKKKAKTLAKNQKRLAAGKDTLEIKPVFFSKLKSEGDPPVIFDSTLAEATIVQFQSALFNYGYFENEVFTKYEYNKDSTKVKVVYSAEVGTQYKVKSVGLVLDDPSIAEAVKKANLDTKLNSGMGYNTEALDEERARFAFEMRNQGYFYFSKEYIEYEIDSALGTHQVDIKVQIKNKETPIPGSDSVTSIKHKKYIIGSITMDPGFNPKLKPKVGDTIIFNHITFDNVHNLQYNPFSLSNKLFFEQGQLYSQRDEARTYTRLSGLNNFKFISINFENNNPDSNLLDCKIQMAPLPKQNIGLELEGTNSQGNLGATGYLTYMHRNIFRNAEQLRIRLKGGVEAQQTNSSDTITENTGIINTFEIGFETSLIFQNLILPSAWRDRILKEFNRPKTSVNFILNNQSRPDFDRGLINTSLAYSFISKKENTNEIVFLPIDISFIDITKQREFEKRLEELNNPQLNATYDDQFIVGLRLLENWTDRQNATQKHYRLNRAQFELAGNVLGLLANLFGAPDNTVTDSITNISDTYKTIGSIRYAQFIKVQNDWSYNTRLKYNQTLSYRVLAGIGLAYGNAISLPYDRSFYGGGANDNRGWRARTLGPGSLPDNADIKVGVDQVADIKIHLTAEYRFNFFKSLEGALFADGGNIWFRPTKEGEKGYDPARELAYFKPGEFYKEIALTTGLGLRINFGFLLVRFDWGFKLYDPGYRKLGPDQDQNHAWLWDRFSFNPEDNNGLDPQNFSTFNLGIGYPF